MSSKQNKKQAETKRKAETEKTKLDGLRNHLLMEKFPLECERLPLSKLPEYEQEIVRKCTNHEELNDKEFQDLSELLEKYRGLIEDIDPEAIIESKKQFAEQLKTEEDFLNYLDEIENRELHLQYNHWGKTRDMYVQIKPLDDSRAVKLTEAHQDIYMDLDPNQRKINQKYLEGKKLTKEEENILADLNEKVLATTITDKSDEILTLLAHQVTPPDFNGNIEKRKKFWASVPFTVRISLYVKLLDILGLKDTENEKLFPDE